MSFSDLETVLGGAQYGILAVLADLALVETNQQFPSTDQGIVSRVSRGELLSDVLLTYALCDAPVPVL